MLSDFTWNMTGYIPKYAVNPHGDGIIPYMAERIFQLEPEPPAVGSLNEYILSALREKNLIYFSFFLHHYEPQLNKRIKGFWGVDGGDLYDTDRFIDIKLSCREQMLQKLMDYDPAKGAEYATYILSLIHICRVVRGLWKGLYSLLSLVQNRPCIGRCSDLHMIGRNGRSQPPTTNVHLHNIVLQSVTGKIGKPDRALEIGRAHV